MGNSGSDMDSILLPVGLIRPHNYQTFLPCHLPRETDAWWSYGHTYHTSALMSVSLPWTQYLDGEFLSFSHFEIIFICVEKGYPHSIMSLAYLRMKFSSEKIKSDLVIEPLTPGRLMCVARLAACRRDGSPPAAPDRFIVSSFVFPSTAKLAILGKDTEGHDAR